METPFFLFAVRHQNLSPLHHHCTSSSNIFDCFSLARRHSHDSAVSLMRKKNSEPVSNRWWTCALSLSYRHPPAQRDEFWEQWPEVWHQLSSYENHGGFPRTWYSGNHWRGRASQLRNGAHILATGIPEVHHYLNSNSSRATPMHPCCPHSVAREWLDPGLMVSLFWVTFLLDVSGCSSSSERSRPVVVWLRLAVLVTGCDTERRDVLLFLSPLKGPKSPVMSSIHYLRPSTSPCGRCLSQHEVQQ